MRYGVISDVHGNVHALEAVLRALERESLDGFVCPGDLVGYGPRPNECVERVRSLGDALVAVAGNHDLMAVDRLPEYALGPLPKRTLDWTRRVLGDAAREYLAGLPLGALTADGVRVAHGSLDDPAAYVGDAAAARSQLRLLGEREPDARVLLIGHTHLPMACSRGAGAMRADGEVDLATTAGGGPWLLNPGSVGQSRERRALARAMVLDTGRGTARFLALEYDARATRRELRDAGLPAHACHLAPGRAARWRRRLGARLAR